MAQQSLVPEQGSGRKQTPSEPSECHFFNLPPELRCKIYGEAFYHLGVGPYRVVGPCRTVEPPHMYPPLLDTCRLIHQEAAPFYAERIASSLTHSVTETTFFIAQIERTVRRHSTRLTDVEFRTTFRSLLLLRSRTIERSRKRVNIVFEELSKMSQKLGVAVAVELSERRKI